MVFSSLIFLFVFFPIILAGYYLIKDDYRNYFLLLASLIFYAWGEPVYVLLMLFSILANYGFGLLVAGGRSKSISKFYVGLSLVFNLGLLGVFKYTGFIMSNINSLFGLDIPYPSLQLPLGISFFTFQALSYVIDVYRNDAKVQKNLFNLALYIALFPQLVAGPIVRYQSVADQMVSRSHTVEKFGEGVKRFMQGMGKKVLIANPLGSVADTVFVIPPDEISVATSWIAIIAYSLQIYFDFSGYSDMAIGLGKMFGFDFLENFNYPYISQSVSEFWRRWHISLGSWFREYVYIPLGGNRVGPIRVYFNLFVVWMLTGFWHGAAWNFVAWGLYFGILIGLEKAFVLKLLSKVYRPIRHLYLIIAVIIGWIFFRASSFGYGIDYMKSMIGANSNQLYDNLTYVFLNDYGVLLLVGLVLSTPVLKWLVGYIMDRKPALLENSVFYISNSLVYGVMFLVIVVKLVNSTYNPFLYFRF
ncbi:MBOAT family O-acyltransferase [Clostridium sp.]|uniref:MBOAT family O-acyltransferase n=1 Tax=Clostridium sp. TaxID=1506 RepID=UPI002FCCA657